MRGLGADEGAPALPLPRSLLLALPVGEGLLEAASAQVLDEAHVAVVGLPHPSAGAGKGKLLKCTASNEDCKCFTQPEHLAGFNSIKCTILSMTDLDLIHLRFTKCFQYAVLVNQNT